MQSADRFGPLKGLCPYKALIGLTQATGLAGGFDFDEKIGKDGIYQKEKLAKKLQKAKKQNSRPSPETLVRRGPFFS